MTEQRTTYSKKDDALLIAGVTDASAMAEMERAISDLWPYARDKKLSSEDVRKLYKMRETIGSIIYVARGDYEL